MLIALDPHAATRAAALQPSPAAARSRRGRAAAAEGGARAVRRRGRARLAGGALSRRGRRRHPRPRRLRRRRLQQPAAADHPRHADVGRSKLESARSRIEALNPEVRVETFDALLGGERAGAGRGVRRHRRRHRQLSRAVSRERRLRDVRAAERVGQHLPVRGAGVGVRGARRAVLSLPAPGAAAGGLCRAAPRRACSACCRGSSAPSRRPRRSS